MSTAISPRTMSPVSRNDATTEPREMQENSGSGFDQHLDAAQRAASKEPVPVSTPLIDRRDRADDHLAHEPVSGAATIAPAATAPQPVANISPTAAAASGSNAGHVAAAHPAADAKDDATAPSDPTLVTGLWAFLVNVPVGGMATAATAATATLADAAAGLGLGSKPRDDADALAIAANGAGSAGRATSPGNSMLQTDALPGTSDGGLSALVASGGVPIAAVASMALRGADDKAPLADLTRSVALLTPSAGAAPLTIHALQLPAPVTGPAFQQTLGQQVVWLTGQQIKQASIRLHPQELGQLDVTVSVHQGSVDVVFNAQHPAAANAVQQTLPQLAHMLAQHGLSLGHAEVGQQSAGHHQGRENHRTEGRAGSASVNEPNAVAAPLTSLGSVNLLDAFA